MLLGTPPHAQIDAIRLGSTKGFQARSAIMMVDCPLERTTYSLCGRRRLAAGCHWMWGGGAVRVAAADPASVIEFKQGSV
jgi:hypothetical protein